jgi:hypothetical protein
MNAPSEIAHGAISVGLLSSFMNSPDRDLLAPGPRNPSHKGDFAIAGDLIYFSFVTLTTTGYGDIARSRCLVHAVTPEIVVARLMACVLSVGRRSISRHRGHFR